MIFYSPDTIKPVSRENLKLSSENYKNVIEIIGKIEGKHWAAKQEAFFTDEKMKDEPDQYTLKAALRTVDNSNERLEELNEELETNQDEEKRNEMKKEIEKYREGFGPKAEIYGAGGVNRYYALSSGEIVISGSHMGFYKKETTELAEKLGIRILK